MAALVSSYNRTSNCCSAAACSSARIQRNLDTVMLLAVSILLPLILI